MHDGVATGVQMENHQCGAFVGDKAKMRLQGCQSTCNRSDGFCAERGGSLKLARCTSDSDRCARSPKNPGLISLSNPRKFTPKNTTFIILPVIKEGVLVRLQICWMCGYLADGEILRCRCGCLSLIHI